MTEHQKDRKGHEACDDLILRQARDEQLTEMKQPPSAAADIGAIGRTGPERNRIATSIIVTTSIAQNSPIAPRNLPKMISKSVSGEVSRSSIVPERFSSGRSAS